ncbi:MAG TPA: hypothetical protein VED19_00340, partial [Candidatus Nitrosopolaris sp.]|nr:hypothetical protein [Candidatus Nitrosopolaris sp.]
MKVWPLNLLVIAGPEYQPEVPARTVSPAALAKKTHIESRWPSMTSAKSCGICDATYFPTPNLIYASRLCK